MRVPMRSSRITKPHAYCTDRQAAFFTCVRLKPRLQAEMCSVGCRAGSIPQKLVFKPCLRQGNKLQYHRPFNRNKTGARFGII